MAACTWTGLGASGQWEDERRWSRPSVWRLLPRLLLLSVTALVPSISDTGSQPIWERRQGSPVPKRLQEGSGPSCGSQSGGPLHRYWPQGWRLGTATPRP